MTAPDAAVPVAELRRLLAEAGLPWVTQKDLPFAFSHRTTPDAVGSVEGSPIGECFGPGRGEKNAALIVDAFNHLPALLDIAEQHQKGGDRNSGQELGDNAKPALADVPERAALPASERRLARRPAYWTHDHDEHAGHLYYFSPTNAARPPYTRQIEVTAIIDVADDGSLAGVELIDNMPPPPVEAAERPASEEVENRAGSLEIYAVGVAKLAEASKTDDGWLKALALALRDTAAMLRKLAQPRQSEGVAKAIEALRPFAETMAELESWRKPSSPPYPDGDKMAVRLGDLRRAAEALAVLLSEGREGK